MVAQHLGPHPAASEETLSVIWHAAAKRTTTRRAMALLATGCAAVLVSVIPARFPIIASLGVLVIAFACYSAVVQPAGIARSWSPAVTRLVMRTASAIAALAAIISVLLFLALVFGGSLEVMRR